MRVAGHTRARVVLRGRFVPVVTIVLLAFGGLAVAQAAADDPPPITVPSVTTTSPAPAPEPAPDPAPVVPPKPATTPAPKPTPKPAAKAPRVHRPATVQRHAPASVVHTQATYVAPAPAPVTPTHVVTRTPVRKHATTAHVKAKTKLKPRAHVKAAVHQIVRKRAAPKATPHPAAALPAPGSPPPSGSNAMVWILLLGVVGGIGLVLFAAGRPMLGSVSRLFEKPAVAEVRARPLLSAAPMPVPPPDAEGRAPTTGRGSGVEEPSDRPPVVL